MVLFILGILALILLMGNAYLYFFPLKNRNDSISGFENGQAGEWERSLVKVREKNFELEKKLALHERAVTKKFKTIDSSILNLDSKAEGAVKRVSRLESIIASKEFQGKPGVLMAKKIERLEDFRRNATIELEAIKELMPQLKEKKQVAVSSPELEEKIHNLVFHGKARK